jgi:hypothetical protein
MKTTRNPWNPWNRCLAFTLCVLAMQIPIVARQHMASATEMKEDASAFRQFSVRIQAYLKLERTVESSLPVLKPTDLPEMITAHQEALARKIKEARPHAKAGDIFTSSASDAFRHASSAALEGPREAARAYMKPDAADPDMHLEVNGIYPATAPITALSPALLARYPALPVELAYRIVGRTLIVIDVESRLIVDVARQILPSGS